MSSYLYLGHDLHEAGALQLDEGSLQSALHETASGHSTWELRMKWNLFSRVEHIVESSWSLALRLLRAHSEAARHPLCLICVLCCFVVRSRISPARFLLWKLLAWSWTVAIYAMTLATSPAPTARFFVFLTNWNQTSLLLYLTCSLYICARHWWGSQARASSGSASHADHLADIYVVDQSHRDAPLSAYTPSATLLRFTYAIFEHSFAWTYLVVLIYWTTEFPRQSPRAAPPHTAPSSHLSIFAGSFSFLFAFVAVCVLGVRAQIGGRRTIPARLTCS